MIILGAVFMSQLYLTLRFVYQLKINITEAYEGKCYFMKNSNNN